MQPMSIVIRIADVSIPRADLEAALNLALDRYETGRRGVTNYAQINIEEEADYWAAASRTMLQLKDKLQALSSAGSIGAISLDAALSFHDDLMAGSTLIPSPLAYLAGQTGIDIEISVYRTQSPDEAQG
jgi:hypothetical protein